MLFSGSYSERQCVSCGHKVARATPTSILFFLLLVAGGSAVVVPLLAVACKSTTSPTGPSKGGHVFLYSVLIEDDEEI